MATVDQAGPSTEHQKLSGDASVGEGWEWGDDDELAVDQSIPSTPVDDHAGWQTPPWVKMEDLDHEGHEIDPRLDHSDQSNARTGRDTRPESGSHAHTSQEGHEPEQVNEDSRQCRICFAGVEEEEQLGRLISPCLCAGSMRYVHVKCINAWRGTGSNAKAFLECPQCHHQYHLRRTLVSGLATSRPLLVILSTIMFILITLFAGSILHYLLTTSSWTRRRLFSARTLFNDLDGDWDDDDGLDGSIIIVGGGGAIVYDVIIGAIQTFTSLAVTFAEATNDIADDLPGPIAEVIFHVGVRFILGLAVLGSVSFLSLLLSMSLFGPLQIINGLRGVGLFGNLTRRRVRTGTGDGTGGGGPLGQMMIVLFVLIGTVNTLIGLYKITQKLTMKMLIYVEAQILEVNPDDRRKAKEEEEARREQSWTRRWAREGRWKTRRGWWELVLRTALRLKIWVRDGYDRWRARMMMAEVEVE